MKRIIVTLEIKSRRKRQRPNIDRNTSNLKVLVSGFGSLLGIAITSGLWADGQTDPLRLILMFALIALLTGIVVLVCKVL